MEPHTVKKRRVRESVEADDSPLADESLRLATQPSLRSFKLVQTVDMDRTLRFLCSESGSYITGETIQVNGGMYLK